MHQEEQVSCEAGVEARVDVEVEVALHADSLRRQYSIIWILAPLVCMATRSVGVNNVTIPVNIADIKEFDILQSVLSTSYVVRCHVIEFAELACQLVMSFVGQIGTANNDGAILDARISGIESFK